jgi:D-glycero-alpha-D-manno-heptose-7-phosphate kinase
LWHKKKILKNEPAEAPPGWKRPESGRSQTQNAEALGQMALRIENIAIVATASIQQALQQLNANQAGIVFVVAENGKVEGCLTDGDIRRQLLKNGDLSISIDSFMNRSFVYATTSSSREHVLKLLDHRVRVVPLLDDEGKLVRLCTRENFQIQDEAEIFARARAPARISFGGGGTDLTHYFVDQGGVVISATIAKYAHASLRRRADGLIRLYSHDLKKTVEAGSLADLGTSGDLNLIRSVIQLIKPAFGFDLEVACDFPVGSGLGGSAAVSVAVIGCFGQFRVAPWERHEIAEMAFQAERFTLNIPGGWQDQYAAVFGGINYMEFDASENVIMSLRLDERILRELEACLVLCHTGKSHDSGRIHADQREKMKASASAEMAARKQKAITDEMRRRLLRGDVYGYGELLHQAWIAKREFSSLISDGDIDSIYEHGLKNGALGGKILGAGGGGYILFFVPPFERYNLCSAMEKSGLRTERVMFDEAGLRAWTMRVPPEAKDRNRAWNDNV